MGSVLASPVNGAPVVSNPAPTIPQPTAYNSASWTTNKALFDGNLIANAPLLQLPIKLNSNNTGQNLDLVEVIKRGKEVGDLWNDGTGTVAAPNIVAVTTARSDDAITAAERYYNKTGVRVSLADSKAKLPGCAAAAAATRCGIRLDGDAGGQTIGAIGAVARGYKPKAMVDGYQATEINGERFWLNIANRELWIKVETVIYNPATEVYDTVDITEEILSLGVTEEALPITTGNTFKITNPGYAGSTDNGPQKRQPLGDQTSAIYVWQHRNSRYFKRHAKRDLRRRNSKLCGFRYQSVRGGHYVRFRGNHSGK